MTSAICVVFEILKSQAVFFIIWIVRWKPLQRCLILVIVPSTNGPVDRDNLEKWLGKMDKKGLHVIRQTTIALLRGWLDDEYEVEISQRREFFGESDLAIPVVYDDEGMDRQYTYRRKIVQEAELFGDGKAGCY